MQPRLLWKARCSQIFLQTSNAHIIRFQIAGNVSSRQNNSHTSSGLLCSIFEHLVRTQPCLGSTSFRLGRVVDVRGASKRPRRMITANRRPSWNSNGQGHYYVIHQQPLSNYPCIDLCFLTCAAYPTSPLQSALPACCILSVEGRSGGAQ